MKQKNKPIVFDLIQSMDRTERGYFIKYSEMLGKGNKYKILFQTLAGMKTFDKKMLEQQLKKKKAGISNLNSAIHHLYPNVLRSLRLFHEKNYYKIQVRNLLSEAEILLRKNMVVQAVKLLNKAEDIATAQHYYTSLIEIQRLKAVQKVAIGTENLMDTVQDNYKVILKNCHTLKEEIHFNKNHHLALICMRVNKMDISHQYNEVIRNISKDPLINSKDKPDSFFSQYYKNSIKSYQAILYSDRVAAHLYYQNILNIWEGNRTMIEAEPLLYRNHLSNYIVNTIFIKKADDFHEQLKKLEQIPTRFQSDKVELFQSIVYLEQLYYLNYRELGKAYKSIQIHSTQLKKYRSKMNFSRLTTIQYNYLIICFLKEKYSEGLDWVNEILYTKNAEPRKNVRLFTRILELILHYELENIDLVESLLASVWRKRKSDDSFYLYTESILNYLKKIMKAINKKQIQKNSKEFLDELLGFEKQSPKPIGIEELIFWVTSKADSVSIEEVYMNYE